MASSKNIMFNNNPSLLEKNENINLMNKALLSSKLITNSSTSLSSSDNITTITENTLKNISSNISKSTELTNTTTTTTSTNSDRNDSKSTIFITNNFNGKEYKNSVHVNNKSILKNLKSLVIINKKIPNVILNRINSNTILELNNKFSNNILIQPSTSNLDRINICINNHYNGPVTTTTTTTTTLAKKSNDVTNIQPKTSWPSIPMCFMHKENSFPKIKKEEPDSTTYHATTEAKMSPEKQINPIFVLSEDVLVQQNDDTFYLGTIVSIGHDGCLVKYDDNTQSWTKFSKLKKFNSNENSSKPFCVVCKKQQVNDIVVDCDKCGRGYHKSCTEGEDNENSSWYCKRCSQEIRFVSACKESRKHKKAAKDKHTNGKGNYSFNMTVPLCKKSQLTYNIDALQWNSNHRVNEEQIYCYCGQNGEWHKQMLQCRCCEQWFHEKCIRCLQYPLFYGDSFYIFVCSMCNYGTEFLRRLELNWSDIVHLLLFNLTEIHKNKKYYDFTTIILPYALDNWKYLQLPQRLRNLTNSDIESKILHTLGKRSEFQSGKETKKQGNLWGLRIMGPPKRTLFQIPYGKVITDGYIKELIIENGKKVVYLPVDESGESYINDGKVRESMGRMNKPRMEIVNSGDDSDEMQIHKNILLNKSFQLSDEETSANNSKTSNKRLEDYLDIYSSNAKDGFSNQSTDKDSRSSSCEKQKPQTTSTATTTTASSTSNRFRLRTRSHNSIKLNNSKTKKETTKKASMAVIDICDSSDTSSRSTLDSIIPPPENFNGLNNPFHNSFRKKNYNIQTVRMVRKRLSANDLNSNDVKRRRVRRQTDNFETATFVPLRNDWISLPIQSKSTANLTNGCSPTSSGTSTPPTPLNEICGAGTPPKIFNNNDNNTSNNNIKMVCGRKLRQRKAHNYKDGQVKRTNSVPSLTTEPLNSSLIVDNNMTGSFSLPGSPLKNGVSSNDCSLNDLQASVNSYFSASNRILRGENYIVRGRRTTSSNKIQYLIEWRGGSTTVL